VPCTPSTGCLPISLMEAALVLRCSLVLVAVVSGVREFADNTASDAQGAASALQVMASTTAAADTALPASTITESAQPPCLCFPNEDGGGEKFNSLEDCAAQCPRTCHRGLEYKFPGHCVTATKCSDKGKCTCLNAEKSFQVRKTTWLAQKLDIAPMTNEGYNKCVKNCNCKDKKGLHFEGFCMHEWRWQWFFSWTAQKNVYDCHKPEVVVGLFFCEYEQTFKLKTETAGQVYTAKLEEIREFERYQGGVATDMDLEVMKFEAEEPSGQQEAGGAEHLKADVIVGPEGARTKWQMAGKSDVWSKTWTVADEHGKEKFTIYSEGSEWMVYHGKGIRASNLRYCATSRREFELEFFRDEQTCRTPGIRDAGRKDDKVAVMEQKHRARGGDAEATYEVRVTKSEDAGVILMTCALTRKAHDDRR